MWLCPTPNAFPVQMHSPDGNHPGFSLIISSFRSGYCKIHPLLWRDTRRWDGASILHQHVTSVRSPSERLYLAVLLLRGGIYLHDFPRSPDTVRREQQWVELSVDNGVPSSRFNSWPRHLAAELECGFTDARPLRQRRRHQSALRKKTICHFIYLFPARPTGFLIMPRMISFPPAALFLPPRSPCACPCCFSFFSTIFFFLLMCQFLVFPAAFLWTLNYCCWK